MFHKIFSKKETKLINGCYLFGIIWKVNSMPLNITADVVELILNHSFSWQKIGNNSMIQTDRVL